MEWMNDRPKDDVTSWWYCLIYASTNKKIPLLWTPFPFDFRFINHMHCCIYSHNCFFIRVRSSLPIVPSPIVTNRGRMSARLHDIASMLGRVPAWIWHWNSDVWLTSNDGFLQWWCRLPWLVPDLQIAVSVWDVLESPFCECWVNVGVLESWRWSGEDLKMMMMMMMNWEIENSTKGLYTFSSSTFDREWPSPKDRERERRIRDRHRQMDWLDQFLRWLRRLIDCAHSIDPIGSRIGKVWALIIRLQGSVVACQIDCAMG